MAKYQLGDRVNLNRKPHIFEGVIIMPSSPVEIEKVNPDGTYDVIYMDRENMPHTMTSIPETDLVEP